MCIAVSPNPNSGGRGRAFPSFTPMIVKLISSSPVSIVISVTKYLRKYLGGLP